MLRNDQKGIFPPENNPQLWRYMSLAKFLALIENRELAFSRADKFPDPYEGWLPLQDINFLKKLVASFESQERVPDKHKDLIELIYRERERMFISCWCASEFESAALWCIYLSGTDGVAVVTDHDTLAGALDKSDLIIRTSMVRYIDCEKDRLPGDYVFEPFVHKRLNFDYEHEVRAMIWSGKEPNESMVPGGATTLFVPVQPEVLIKAVHVSPTDSEWLGALVEKLLRRYEIEVPIERSGLYERPTI